MRNRVDRAKFAAALVRKNITVKELSEVTGISRATISGVKNGKSCNDETMRKLCAILGQGIIDKAAATADNSSK